MKCIAAWFDCEDGFCFALKTGKGERVITVIPESEIRFGDGLWSGNGSVIRSRNKKCNKLLEEIWEKEEK